MRESSHELAVGESILVGDRLFTVVEITATEVTLRIEQVQVDTEHQGTLETGEWMGGDAHQDEPGHLGNPGHDYDSDRPSLRFRPR